MDENSLTDRRAVVRVTAGHDEVEAAIRDGVSDSDVAVAAVGPTGVASLEPLVTATIAGETAVYPACSSSVAQEVATGIANGEVGEAGNPAAIVEHDPEVATFPRGLGTALDVGQRHVLGGSGWHRPTVRADHRAAGGFVDADPRAVVEAARDLQGRGWGDWCHDEPILGAVRQARDAGDVAVVVNAHGSAADRLLLESVPYAVLDGADLLARAVDADRVVVYASETDGTAVVRARSAVANYPDPAASTAVVTGPPVYRAAEPTMALEAIEGNHRLEARLRQPGRLPRLDGRPALIHTARTLAHLARRVGGDEEATDPPDTRLLTVTGDVESSATVELGELDRLDEAMRAVTVDGTFKAAAVGGRFGGLTSSLDANADALAEHDLGTDGVVEVLAADRCLLEFVGRRAQLAADTNCGRCVPCREGSTQLAELLRDVYDGDYDASAISELCRVLEGSSVCSFGVEAARPARTAMRRFEDEIRAHADGHCPAGTCFERVEVTQ